MKAIIQKRFGSPEVVQLVDTDLPEIGVDDVLVRVHAAALTPMTGTCCAAIPTLPGSWAALG